MVAIWIKFIVCALVILWAGVKLAKYGDVIAEKTGISKLFIGTIVLAMITSLPELSSGISAVTSLKIPDLAVANVVGSCLINLLAIAFLDFVYNKKGKGPILGEAGFGHVLAAGLSILLLSLCLAGILSSLLLVPISLWVVSFYSVAIFLVYILCERLICRFEGRECDRFLEKKIQKTEKQEFEKNTAASAYTKFLLLAILVAAASSYLPAIAREMAIAYNLSYTFSGSVFMSLACSLPEIAVAFSAMMIGSIDMAIASLIGSNIFNIAAIFFFDFFYGEAPIFSQLSLSNAFLCAMAIFMTAIAIMGLIYRSHKGVEKKIRWDAIGLVVAYIFAMLILYKIN